MRDGLPRASQDIKLSRFGQPNCALCPICNWLVPGKDQARRCRAFTGICRQFEQRPPDCGRHPLDHLRAEETHKDGPGSCLLGPFSRKPTRASILLRMTPAGKAIAVFTTNELNVRIAEDSSNRCGLKVLIEIFSFLRDAVDVFLFDLPATGAQGPVRPAKAMSAPARHACTKRACTTLAQK